MLFSTDRAFSSGSLTPLLRPVTNENELASHIMPLDDRYAVPSVNSVFRDNILLTIRYMSGDVHKASEINWDEVRKPFTYEFTLQPGEVFAYHDGILPEYQGKKIVTTNAHFNGQEGFISDGYLYGDGVCHFASLMNWVAQDAGLKVEARVRHDFAKIPDISPEYGTSIFASQGQSGSNEQNQNLYIENTTDKSVKFVFAYKDDKLTFSIVKLK